MPRNERHRRLRLRACVRGIAPHPHPSRQAGGRRNARSRLSCATNGQQTCARRRDKRERRRARASAAQRATSSPRAARARSGRREGMRAARARAARARAARAAGVCARDAGATCADVEHTCERTQREREQAGAMTRPGIEPGRREPPGSAKTTRARDESKRGKQTARAPGLSCARNRSAAPARFAQPARESNPAIGTDVRGLPSVALGQTLTESNCAAISSWTAARSAQQNSQYHDAGCHAWHSLGGCARRRKLSDEIAPPSTPSRALGQPFVQLPCWVASKLPIMNCSY